MLAEASRFNVLACGRRWGKTVICEDRAVDGLLPRSGRTDSRVGWFCYTDKSFEESWDRLNDTLAPLIVGGKGRREDRRIELVNGAVMEFWSLSARPVARGRRYHRVIIDEAAHCPRLQEAWTKEIRATLVDFEGDAWFPSSPNGRGYFATLYGFGQDPLKPEWMSWRMPSGANPHLKPAEVLAMRGELPELVARQEIDAEFIDDVGCVFKGVVECVDVGRVASERHNPDRRHAIGVDLARVQDYTVIDVLDDRKRQVHHERHQLASWEYQIGRVNAIAERYPGSPIVIDSTGVGDPIAERCKGFGRVIPYHFTYDSKKHVIDRLALAIDSRQLRLMDIPVQTTELEDYRYVITAARNTTTSAPEGAHDDCVTALALAYHGIDRSRSMEAS